MLVSELEKCDSSPSSSVVYLLRDNFPKVEKPATGVLSGLTERQKSRPYLPLNLPTSSHFLAAGQIKHITSPYEPSLSSLDSSGQD